MALRTAGRLISRRLFSGTRSFSGKTTSTEAVGAKIKDREVRIIYEKIRKAELNAKKIQAKHNELRKAINRDPVLIITAFLVNFSMGCFIIRHAARVCREI